MGEETLALDWPSTTGIIRHFGLMANYNGVSGGNAMSRGRLIHAACHLLAVGDADLAWEARHPECMPYVDAYRKFLREHTFRLMECEKEYRSQALRFISHPDQIGLLDGKRPANLELKSGGLPRWVQLQTAGQVLAMGAPHMQRFALHLKADGNYALHAHEDFRDLDRFRAMVDTYWTQREFNPFEEGAIPP